MLHFETSLLMATRFYDFVPVFILALLVFGGGASTFMQPLHLLSPFLPLLLVTLRISNRFGGLACTLAPNFIAVLNLGVRDHFQPSGNLGLFGLFLGCIFAR